MAITLSACEATVKLLQKNVNIKKATLSSLQNSIVARKANLLAQQKAKAKLSAQPPHVVPIGKAPPGYYSQIPSLEVIVDKVLKATTPTNSYTVTINQSINKISSLFKKTIQFNAIFDLHIGLKAQKVIDNNKIENQISKNKPTLIKKGDVRLIINYTNFFKNINKWKAIKIILINFNNRNYFKITAQNKPFSYSFWVDASNYYVSRAILNINNKEFSEININYKHINNKYWVPVQLTFKNASDGTLTTQIFSDYIFNKANLLLGAPTQTTGIKKTINPTKTTGINIKKLPTCTEYTAMIKKQNAFWKPGEGRPLRNPKGIPGVNCYTPITTTSTTTINPQLLAMQQEQARDLAIHQAKAQALAIAQARIAQANTLAQARIEQAKAKLSAQAPYVVPIGKAPPEHTITTAPSSSYENRQAHLLLDANTQTTGTNLQAATVSSSGKPKYIVLLVGAAVLLLLIGNRGH